MDLVPNWASNNSGEHRKAEDAARAEKLVKEAEKRRKREQEEREKALIAESRRRAAETKQKH